ncbi:MAG: hypothetical protein LBT29_02275 [Flavobacteriaceae bacterium]|nr:hypothetical protein [Flavobacteriaceae bacterium]
MKKTILNIAAIVAIVGTSFVACDKKAGTDAAPATTDSTAVATDSAAAVAPDSTAAAAPATEATPAPAADKAPAAEPAAK